MKKLIAHCSLLIASLTISYQLLAISILIIAAFLRLYGINWDQGMSFHPDERMIVMVAQRISLPDTFIQLLTVDSPLNPKFFAYGSFPIYLLQGVSNLANLTNFQQMLTLGRVLSSFFDLGTIYLIFLIGKKIFNLKVGLLSALFYTLSTLPIQLSHFYAVDTILTFFITLTLYLSLKLIEKLSLENIILIAVALAFSLATKISAMIVLLPIALSFLTHFKRLLKTLLYGLIFLISAVAIYFDLSPFTLIDWENFLKQTLEQQQMTKDAFTFPYTLQYVDKTPYFYELQNIFFWGLGPILSTLSFLGVIFFTIRTFYSHITYHILLLTFFWSYFIVIGSFAIGFMRYMLPLYPLLCLFAASLFYYLISLLKNNSFRLIANGSLLIALLIWPLSFLNIYNFPNTRNQATTWINENIPFGSKIATEHWDDGLPVGTQSNYQILELPMYDTDTEEKWLKIDSSLEQTDYLILASHRLYVPLQKLTDCQNLPQGRCYQKSAKYYQKLFADHLQFSQVAQFKVQPKIPILNIEINDFYADESFTVYDHPQVYIFKKI